MSDADIMELNHLLKGYKHDLATYNKLIGGMKGELVSEAATAVRKNISHSLGHKARGAVASFFHTKLIRPQTMVLDIAGYDENSPLYKAWQDLNRAVMQRTADQQDIKNEILNAYREFKKFAKNMRSDKTLIDTGIKNPDGEPLKLTYGQLIDLYMYAQDPDGRAHIVGREAVDSKGNITHTDGGGITVYDANYERRGMTQEAHNSGKHFNLTNEQLNDIIENAPEEVKKIAEVFRRAIDNYNESMAKASEALYGYNKFDKESYWRISVDSNYRARFQ